MRRLLPVVIAMLIPFSPPGTIRPIALGGREQKLHLYGPVNGPPVIVSSGDGGWIHLAPQMASWLAVRGYFVIGFDVKAYLAGGTTGSSTLTRADVERDYGTLLSTFGHERPVILAGVSEGAGLSVLAAGAAANKRHLAGVIAVSLGEQNELGWRWKDSIIYVTKGVPHEPLFSATALMPLVTPVPLAIIRATHDEFVPPQESDRLIAAAASPSHAWTVAASDHRFSDNEAGFDSAMTAALAWIRGAR
jgi:type IV secretory pathway VirJ component